MTRVPGHPRPPQRAHLKSGPTRQIQFGSAVHEKAADIVVFDRDDPEAAYIIVECKKPKRRDGVEQLKSYCNAEGSPIGVWTNGGEAVILHRQDPNIFRNLTDIPTVDQRLSDVLEERWTIDDLTRENKLVRERRSLKSVILDMENLVLANAGVDAFEEVFKLIYAKLYDEWYASRTSGRTRYVQFRIGGCTASEFYEKIDRLFQRAKTKWPDVFVEGETIELTPEHLLTCGSFLEDIKLFNSNLQIIDEAFEYLSVEVGKTSKGQYFTPRHVIDMCVAMLNPREEEYAIDTASGSCGFTVHSIFHVWGNEFTAEGPDEWQREYAREKAFGIDFDARSNKIAKALNLIAGDGRTNVYKANTLDPRGWSEKVRTGLRPMLRRFRNRDEERDNQRRFRYFNFDVLMTNPPFAGDIKDSRILHQYDLAKKRTGRGWLSKVGRDILFIERNLEFLRPGGRMCTVLPDSRLNNVTDQHVREFIDQHARILACVSLHVFTFKPHANTKTSVLFLQKWNDDAELGPLCPREGDYSIFFAESEIPGKDSRGEYVYRFGEDGNPEVDGHGHMIIHHDLDKISEAFWEFGKEQGFEFLQEKEE